MLSTGPLLQFVVFQVELARAYFEKKEFMRAAHVVRQSTSSRAVFLRGYAKFLVTFDAYLAPSNRCPTTGWREIQSRQPSRLLPSPARRDD